jgi:aspartate kinase
MMQNSAISFSVCVDDDNGKVADLITDLKHNYKIAYNQGVRLLTVRHYTETILEELIGKAEILLEQKSRNTARLVLK